ncbi:MAG: DUF3467 domain-containing protein [Candidatus Doudnabacteria bacterium]
MDTPQQQNINVKITDDVLKGAYANNMFVSHTKEEFILDFINITFFPPPGQGIATAKVITNPGHFKRIVAALSDNLKKYEEQFGKIADQNPQAPVAPSSTSDRGFGFGSK